MAGLDPAIKAGSQGASMNGFSFQVYAWMAESSPAMTR